jgi:hypothetical protein
VTGALTLVGPTDTVFSQGTNVLQPGDDLLQVSIDYVTTNSPVGPVVDGRIAGP